MSSLAMGVPVTDSVGMWRAVAVGNGIRETSRQNADRIPLHSSGHLPCSQIL
jgi:hypothetical protein